MRLMRQPLSLLPDPAPGSAFSDVSGCSLLLTADGQVAPQQSSAAQALQGTALSMDEQRRLLWRSSGAPLPLSGYLTRLRFRSGKPLLSLIHHSGVGTLVAHFSSAVEEGHGAVRFRFADSGAPSAVQQHLRTEFRLTPTELEVADGLASGVGVGDLALLRGCSVSTMRTHTASILGKMGINRQSELICVIAQLNQLLSRPA